MTAGLGRLIAWLVLVCTCLTGAFAQSLQPIPPLTAHVVDQTNTFDAIELKGLDEKLLEYEKRKGTQIAVLMVASAQPEDIASFANRAANSWKIGRKGVGDGVLIVVAKDDHKVRIEVAKTLEGAIPDLAAKNIIDDVITPNFKKGDFAGGLRLATDQLIARIEGEALPDPKQPKANAGGLGALGNIDWTTAAMFIFIGVPVVGGILKGMFGRTFGSLATGAGVGTIALLVTSSLFMAGIAAFIALLVALLTGGGMGRRGGLGGVPIVWGGGGGGGGFGGGGGGSSWGGSGGGGDFGGGGASGSW